jgi:hypothetical protein
MPSGDLGLNITASGLDLEAGVVDLRSRTAGSNNGSSDPGDGLSPAQQPPDQEGLLDRTTRRMKIERTLRVLHIPQETADARGSILIDLAFNGNPAITTRTARVRSALGKIDDQFRRKPRIVGSRFGSHYPGNQQEGGDEKDPKRHVNG